MILFTRFLFVSCIKSPSNKVSTAIENITKALNSDVFFPFPRVIVLQTVGRKDILSPPTSRVTRVADPGKYYPDPDPTLERINGKQTLRKPGSESAPNKPAHNKFTVAFFSLIILNQYIW